MELGMIGLGRMGGNMAQRLIKGGHRCVVYDVDKRAVESAVKDGAVGAASIEELTLKLSKPRIVWVMVPSGNVTEDTINKLSMSLDPGDIIVDGGNSNYKDSMRRAVNVGQRGIRLLDAGTSGGIWGLENGYCLMVGGDIEAFHRLGPLLQTLAPTPTTGYAYVGPSGAGHFVKMIHNAIEYGLMEAYAEGFEIMEAKKEFNLDLPAIAEVWRHGSVVRSWLLDLTGAALKDDPKLEQIQAYVEDSGEGRWTVAESIDLSVPAPVITLALQARFRSRQSQPFGAKLLAALRQQFGGHAVRKTK